mmetsp:Transcript_7324/g.21778  ORF Transcript_7324/g.21778 Transcript_7324/m.21778 type:complete len:2162 (-) Transcript_7324:11-6496(-)
MSGRKSSTGSMKQTTLASFFKKPSTKAPEEPAKQKGPGAEVVGRRLKVWWPADEAWYSGGVASYDGERHAIQYDDGDEEDKVPQDRLRKITATSPASQKTVAIAEPDIWRADDDHESVSDEPTQAPGGDSASGLTSSQDYDDDFDEVVTAEGAAKYVFEPGLLGEGAYGEVKQARHRETGQQVAVKRLKVVVEGEDDDDAARYAVQTAERERDVLLLLGRDHKNVACLVDWWREDVKIKPQQTVSAPVLCFELAGSTCLEALEELGPLPKGLCVGLTSDLCAGLAHAHSLGIVHRDVKPENVLLSRDATKDDLQRSWDDPQRPQLRLCDFGAARKLEDVSGKSCLDLTHYIGSRWYRAPEMMASSTKYGVAVDVWGAACITAELATGEPLFPGDDEHAVLRRVSRVLGPFPEQVGQYLMGLGVPRRCLDAGPAPGLKASRRGALVKALSEPVVDVLKDMLHCDSNLRPSASECVIRLQAAMRPATAKVEEAPLKCWSECERLKQTWEPVVQAGATAFKTSANQPHRAVPDAQQLYAAAADALAEAVSENREGVSAWLRELLLGEDTPPGAARSVIRCLRWSVDAAVVPRVARCRDWVLAQQQRGELTLTQAVDAVEAQVGRVDATGSKRASAAAHALQRAYCLLAEASVENPPKVLQDLSEPDSSNQEEKNDLGAGSDVGCAALTETPALAPGESSLGAAEERFHVRSVNEALAVVTPMLVDSEVASVAKARGLLRLEGLLGLPRLRDHAALLRPASKAALLYVALARRPAQRLNLVTSRKRAWEDCEALLEKHAGALQEASSQVLSDDAFALEEESDDESVSLEDEDDPPIKGEASFVVCPYYRVPFGQKYVEGSAVEEGEGLGPRKELFALLGGAVTRSWTPVIGDPLRVEASEGARSLRVTCDEANPQVVKSGDCLAVDFEGDTLELQVEKVSDNVVRVSTNAPAVRVLAKRYGDSEDAETKLLEALTGSVCEARRSAAPLLAHRKDLEALWPNPALPRTAENAKRLATLGLLIGSAVPNQCQLPLDLPPLFFEVLGVAEDAPNDTATHLVDHFLAKRGDAGLRALDASYDDALRGLRALDATGIQSVADMEGITLSSQDHALEVARKASLERCRELEWQLRALRRGFERAMPKKVRRAVRPSARDLQRVACGAPEVRGDFRFRDVFRVVMDAELRDCRPLHDALWAVVDGEDDALNDLELKKIDDLTGEEAPRRCEPLTPAQRRKLLVFVTGVSRLPARHAEFLTVELPFLPFGVDEQRRMLAMVPQSHTCDNILELPNYWEALLKTKTDEARPPRRGSRECNALERELRRIVREKLLVALDNAVGYGLDALEPHVTHALACAAAEDDAAAAALLASSRAMRDARASDDAQYDPFDDEESIPSLPELKEDDDDPIPMLQEATAATTRPSLQSDDDIPDLLDAPKQEDNSVDLEILHALAASPIRDARPASPDAELSVGDLGGGDDDLAEEELGVTFKPVEQDLRESPARPKGQNEDVLDEEVSDDDAVAPSRRNSLSSAGRPATPEPVDQPTTPAAADDFSDVEELETAQLPKTPAAEDLSDAEELEPSKPASEFAVGARVEARFEGGDKWYPGKVFSVHDDGHYVIHYDDGDEEDRVPAAFVRKAEPVAEEPAAAAAGDDDGDDFLAGIEDELGLNTTAQKSETPADEPSQPANPSSDDDLSDVLAGLDDDLPGLDLEKPVEAPREPEPTPAPEPERLAEAAPETPAAELSDAEEPKQPDPETPELPTEEAPTFAQPPTTPAAASDLSDVEELEPFKPKTPAAADDLSDVEELEPEPAKPAPAKPATPPATETFAIGARIEARFNGSDAWYPGKVFTAHPDGTYYIRFDDGDEQDNVPAADVRKADEPAAEEPAGDILADLEEDLPGLDLEKPAEPEEPAKPPATAAEPAFAIGARVEARYNGGESWYPGKIFTVHPDGTHFIKYDDGDTEDNVPAAYIRPEPAAEPEPAEEPKPAKQMGSMLADVESDSSDGEVSLRQVTPPAEEPAAAQPEQEEDILAGLGDLGLDSASVAEPPKAADKPTDEFDYDELEADLFGGSDDAVKPGTAGTRPTTVDSRDYDDSRPSTYDSRSYSNRAGTAGTDGYSYSNYDSRPETREPADSKPGTAGTAGGYFDSRPQTEGTDYNFDDDFSDFEI